MPPKPANPSMEDISSHIAEQFELGNLAQQFADLDQRIHTSRSNKEEHFTLLVNSINELRSLLTAQGKTQVDSTPSSAPPYNTASSSQHHSEHFPTFHLPPNTNQPPINIKPPKINFPPSWLQPTGLDFPSRTIFPILQNPSDPTFGDNFLLYAWPCPELVQMDDNQQSAVNLGGVFTSPRTPIRSFNL